MKIESLSGRKTALITGGSSGIGYELAQQFAKHGHNVVLVARNQNRLKEIAAELSKKFGIDAIAIVKDLSMPSAAEELVAELNDRTISIDFLVNNAGFSVYGKFSETDMPTELEMIQVNITALTQLTKLLLPGMLKRNSGKILNLASTVAFAPGPFVSVYSATKAYVLSFSEALAVELEGTGVSVTALCPGPTRTGFADRANMKKSRIFQGNIMSAQKVAEIGFRSLMEGKTTVITGAANKFTVFSMRLSLRKMVAKISKNLLQNVN